MDLTAVRHNAGTVRRLTGCGLLAVVKANAYGHGAAEVARAALAGGATGLAVACVAEGEQLRAAGVEAPVLVLSAGDPADAADIVGLGLSQTVCAVEMAVALSRAAGQLQRPARVHLKVDTGMGRLGVQPKEVSELGPVLCGLPGLSVAGVFTHLATAEDEDPSYAQWQFARFQEALRALEPIGACGTRHMANSAAALRFPEMRLDAVRTGLLVYGIPPDAPGLPPLDVQPALTWKTRVAFARRLPRGCAISYGRTYVTDCERLIGMLPIGYADGYPRHASNKAQVLVRGVRCPAVGTICMDHMAVDLTPAGRRRAVAGEVTAGEEVVLIGAQGQDRITANDLAAWAGTVVHAVPTVIGNRVLRRYVEESRE